MIRVILPYHLQSLARTGREVSLTVDGPVTPGSILDALEAGLTAALDLLRDRVRRQRVPQPIALDDPRRAALSRRDGPGADHPDHDP